MKILFRDYFKFTQAVLAMFMVTHLVAESMPLASHKEIAIFRENMKQQIEKAKKAKGTDLDVVGALVIAEDYYDRFLNDPITFSRYALGMMIGNGYPDGVTTGLKATPSEEQVIKEIIEKAAAHGRNLQFSADQIWSARPRQDAVQKHAHILSDLSRVVQLDPSFEYKSRKSQKYDTDQILQEICASFAGTPAAELMALAQADIVQATTKSFILTFPLLSEFEQSEIVEVFNKSKASDDFGKDVEQAFAYVSTSCNSRKNASDFVENSVLEPVVHLIETIPAGQIQSLDHLGSTLEQRDAIRTFVEEVNKLRPQRKEICLNALFKTLDLPVESHAIAPPIQALIDKIPLKPVIHNRAEAGKFTLSQYALIKKCIDAIKRLEPIWQDIHYRALIAKIRLMNLDTTNRQINIFNRQKTAMIEALIANRIKAITPPKELISPVPIADNPDGSVDSAVALAPLIADANILEHINIYGYPADEFGPASNDYRIIDTGAAVNKRLANFLAHHCIANYIPAASDAQRQQIIHTVRQKLAQLDTYQPGTLIEKKCAKIALIEGVLHQLLSNQPALPPPQLLLDHQNEVATRNALINDLVIARLAAMGLCFGDDPDIDQQIRQVVESDVPQVPPLPAVGHDYSNVQNVIALIDAIPPPETHVYTNMEKIKELPSVDWDGALQNYVFAANRLPELSRQPAETDQAYWARIGLYCIDAYNRKIKPHIFPDGLLVALNAAQGAVPQLLPFTAPMFDGVDDATNVYSFYTPGGAPQLDVNGVLLNIQNIPVDILEGEYRQQIHGFDLTRPHLNAQTLQFKENISRAYERIHAYAIKTLTELFGTGTPLVAPSAGEDLAHHWNFPAGFTPERIELCKKALLIFAYFDRAGDNYAVDYADMQMLIGRFAHCPDGKKTGIENIASRALTALSGQVLAAAGDFDTYVKNIILRTFKSDSIEELSAHEHYENVSMIATIKHRNQAFWNTPTDILPYYIEYYFDSDYAFMPFFGYSNATAAQRNANYPNIDRFLQYFYQHIYAGPHELVNQIYQYLHSANPAARAAFFDHVRAMLKTRRPFHDWAEEDSAQDFIKVLMQERYCDVIAPAPAAQAVAAAAIGDELEPDYIFTRRGIETILFYAGYLAWNGPADQHPLIAEWQANLAWLHAHHPADYNKIYTH